MLYLDSSAIVKLISAEPETEALLELVRAQSEIVSSALAKVEVMRAVRRLGTRREHEQRAARVLSGIALIRIDDSILERAAEIKPGTLRTLDAIHLATALSVRDSLEALVVYDHRLQQAAERLDLSVAAPS